MIVFHQIMGPSQEIPALHLLAAQDHPVTPKILEWVWILRNLLQILALCPSHLTRRFHCFPFKRTLVFWKKMKKHWGKYFPLDSLSQCIHALYIPYIPTHMKQFTTYFFVQSFLYLSSTEEINRDLPSPGDSEGSPRSIHPRTRVRSLPAADLLRPGAKNLRQRRQEKAMSFTSRVDKGSSDLTTVKDEVTHITSS